METQFISDPSLWYYLPAVVPDISGNAVGLPNAVNFCGDYVNYTDRATGQKTGQTFDHWFNNDPKCYAAFPQNSINTNLPPRFSGTTGWPHISDSF